MKVLGVEDDERRMVYFDDWFRSDDLWWAETAEQGVKLLNEHDDFDLVCLDHDLAATHYKNLKRSATTAKGTGREVANHLAKKKLDKKPFVIVHSWNPYGARAMQETLHDAGFDTCQRMFGPVIEQIIKQVRKRLSS